MSCVTYHVCDNSTVASRPHGLSKRSRKHPFVLQFRRSVNDNYSRFPSGMLPLPRDAWRCDAMGRKRREDMPWAPRALVPCQSTSTVGSLAEPGSTMSKGIKGMTWHGRSSRRRTLRGLMVSWAEDPFKPSTHQALSSSLQQQAHSC